MNCNMGVTITYCLQLLSSLTQAKTQLRNNPQTTTRTRYTLCVMNVNNKAEYEQLLIY